MGWQHGSFSHLLYVEAMAPTGKWEPGFSPIIGLHRPGIDTGWAFTWEHKPSKFQVNGSAGVTFNFENTATDYRTGDEFHFEWAVGRKVSTGLVVGVVGYDYRQFTGDSGSGANLGPFKGSVDAIGAGVSYTTLIGKSPLIVNMRFYHEFDAENRWEGDAFHSLHHASLVRRSDLHVWSASPPGSKLPVDRQNDDGVPRRGRDAGGLGVPPLLGETTDAPTSLRRCAPAGEASQK